MTYHVYRLSHKHNKIDNYLKQIINLYYKIDDDGKIVKCTKDKYHNQEALKQCYRRIEINATLMKYYVCEFPISYKGKDKFEQVIESISHSPEIVDDYDKLSDDYKKFCKNIAKKDGLFRLIKVKIQLIILYLKKK